MHYTPFANTNNDVTTLENDGMVQNISRTKPDFSMK